MHIQSDYPNDFETTKLPPQHTARMNGFASANNFRASFSALPNTTRTQANPSVIGAASLRDTNNYYPPSADMYSSQVTSPIQSHLQSYEATNGYEFGGPKAYLDNFAPNGHMVHHQGGRLSIAHPQQQPPHHKFNGHQFGNGIQLTSQTPYGPHVPVTGSTGPGGNMSQGTAPREITSSVSGNVPNQEEISTIFVVGFPDDMQEREFQNMFTFSAGFEAATLKIPNKEYTAYGANGIRGFQGYNGSNDPYNLVTVNQGGVVVDGGRDGTMSSWPTVPGDDGTGNHFPGTNLAPRKQIIGFAKFKSREAALEAREFLQGRRVDIEKGAVLKAEMAKKNLHTKRGVGPVAGPAAPAPLNVSNSVQSNAHGHGPMITHTNDSFSLPNDGFPPRDRDLPLGGIDLGQHGTWRDQLQKDVHAVTNGIGSARTAEFHPRKEREDEEHRRRERDVTMYNAMGFGSAVGHSATRGPRERAEEEERERRRRDKEAVLRASNSTAFDAFHSVPAGNAPPLSRQSSNLSGIVNGNSLLPTVEANSSHGSPLLSNAFASNQREEAVGPWDNIHNAPIGITRPRSSSQRSVSPPDLQERRDAHYSPSTDVEQTHHLHRAPSESSASSVVGSHSVGVIGGGSSVASNASEGDLNRAMNELVLNTDNGTTSPQLPSPASGASSISTKNAVDQNPPINTLYVGNLPATSPSINFSNDQLEEKIRQLFIAQPGYRRLVFRQKNNGPMCFVEFEDVDHAAKALADLYGNTLNGLVKGGIRLSYSKNPLGVRTPTSATGPNATFQQQQIMQPLNFQPDAFQSRGGDDLGTQPHISRRDVGGPFGNSFLTSPPPRFTSPPAGNFGQAPLSNMPHSFGMRPNGGSLSSLYSYSLAAAGGVGNPTSNFSPFGMSNPPTIPEHTSSSDDQALHSSHHFAHRTLSPPVNLEAARAG